MVQGLLTRFSSVLVVLGQGYLIKIFRKCLMSESELNINELKKVRLELAD